eukprot:symbB.v1.2.002153.t1/scaffold116.1/size325063/10
MASPSDKKEASASSPGLPFLLLSAALLPISIWYQHKTVSQNQIQVVEISAVSESWQGEAEFAMNGQMLISSPPPGLEPDLAAAAFREAAVSEVRPATVEALEEKLKGLGPEASREAILEAPFFLAAAKMGNFMDKLLARVVNAITHGRPSTSYGKLWVLEPLRFFPLVA